MYICVEIVAKKWKHALQNMINKLKVHGKIVKQLNANESTCK